MSTPQALNPLTMPLAGMQVIEASAGTGKTWTLAALYVRLVLGHGRGEPLYPPQILVMTFTDAATSELRGRVRERLAQAALFFKDDDAVEADPFLHSLRDEFPQDSWPACAQRLDLAAQWMDDAAIFTIHGWSSRMLKQHAFDSASLFQQSRVEDSDALRLTAVQDYWRKWFYAVPMSQLGALQGLGSDPEALFDKLKSIWAESDKAPHVADDAAAVEKDPQALLQEWDVWQAQSQQLEDTARQACTADVMALLNDAIAAKQIKGYRKDWPGKLAEWAQGEPLLQLSKKERSTAQTLLERFTTSTLQDKGWSAAANHIAFAHIQALCDHLNAEPEVGTQLLQHAAKHIASAYTQSKSQLAQFDFSDLLQCLYYALRAPDGRLAAAIRQQYAVALVDEFQDTDPWQYGALSTIYAEAPDSGLLMIGDPKQAIYSFRGADLDTYLAARNEAQAIYTLSGNFRSTAQVVNAVNHVFSQAVKPFGEVPFDTVEARNTKVQALQVDGRQQAAMTVWHVSAATTRKDNLQQQLADLFASQMVQLLNAQAATPGQMAVLVRSGIEAHVMRQALSQRGVRSVYLSERDSVYATQEAQDLWRMLRAVANPRSTQGLRAALATRLWGLSFDALEALFQDEDAWDALVEQFHGWQAVWQRQGFLPMLHRVLHDQAIPSRLLAAVDAQHFDGERRLTNLMHLGDLLQTASAGLQGEAALVRYLEQQLHNPKASGDTAQLRLESDANLVQIITIHKSKGLQYPLVFLPFASGFRAEKEEGADAERLAEDIRLLYVAMTRAERALWMGLAPYKGDMDGKIPQIKSAVSYLLQRQSPDDLVARLSTWSACADIVVQAAPQADSTPYQPQLPERHWKPALQPQRRLHSRWWTASFSALTRELGHAAPHATDPGDDRDARIDDALIDSATPAAASAEQSATLRYNDFPAGSSYGTLLHDLLEWQFEHGWPIAGDVAASREWTALLQMKAQRLKLDAEHSGVLDGWLQQVVQTPLPLRGAARPLVLAGLDPQKAWAEMSFTLPVHAVAANQLDALIDQHVLPGQPRSPLQPLQLEGMLIGFMDMVLEHQGRYFVLDYKSNRLASYAGTALQDAILQHRYDVQYTLYTLALHRLLRSRLPDYDYDQHVGGAIYLFLRGVDQPGHGVFVDRPPRELIEALDAAFAQHAVPTEVLP